MYAYHDAAWTRQNYPFEDDEHYALDWTTASSIELQFNPYKETATARLYLDNHLIHTAHETNIGSLKSAEEWAVSVMQQFLHDFAKTAMNAERELRNTKAWKGTM